MYTALSVSLFSFSSINIIFFSSNIADKDSDVRFLSFAFR